MPKKFMQRYLPTREKVQSIRSLHFLGDILHEPNLWHINRHSVARAFLVGLFWCFIPMPFQMAAAAFLAIWINANLPLSVALVWISNPLTMPPIFYFNYRIGAAMLDWPVEVVSFELTLDWFRSQLTDIGIPLYLGSVVTATLAGCTGYLIIQYLWRRRVRKSWIQRQQARYNKRRRRTSDGQETFGAPD